MATLSSARVRPRLRTLVVPKAPQGVRAAGALWSASSSGPFTDTWGAQDPESGDVSLRSLVPSQAWTQPQFPDQASFHLAVVTS